MSQLPGPKRPIEDRDHVSPGLSAVNGHAHPVGDAAAWWDRWLARKMLQAWHNPPVALQLWGTHPIVPPQAPPAVTLRIANRRTLWRLALDPWFHFGEAYSRGELQVEGSLERFLHIVYMSLYQRTAWGRFWSRLIHPQRGTSLRRARKNVHHHYDLGNDFYRLWLDEQMVYTCAYYERPGISLEEAQVAKMDHVCRKLRLQPGESVVEAGCGWGAFALHMARRYGVRVWAYNVSPSQIAYARGQAREQGLEDRVEFVLQDWREIRRPCDVFVSIGMLEHVGRRNYRRLGQVIDRCLSAQGRGLLHSIGQNRGWPANPWIERRIFPGGYAPTLSEAQQVLEPFEFSVLDVENLRLHYAQTLHHWLERYEEHLPAVRRMFGEQFERIWRLYLCGSIAAFECGALQLFQISFARPLLNDLPRTRAHLYFPAEDPRLETSDRQTGGNGDAKHSSMAGRQARPR
jgi:cyclopropane-fatty-acyl-phospholipid synthase